VKKKSKIRLELVSDAKVSVVEQLPRLRRFVGWRHDGTEFVKTGKPTEVVFNEYYVKAVHNGELKPADMESANLCRVTWVMPSDFFEKREELIKENLIKEEILEGDEEEDYGQLSSYEMEEYSKKRF